MTQFDRQAVCSNCIDRQAVCSNCIDRQAVCSNCIDKFLREAIRELMTNWWQSLWENDEWIRIRLYKSFFLQTRYGQFECAFWTNASVLSNEWYYVSSAKLFQKAESHTKCVQHLQTVWLPSSDSLATQFRQPGYPVQTARLPSSDSLATQFRQPGYPVRTAWLPSSDSLATQFINETFKIAGECCWPAVCCDALTKQNT